MNLSLICIKRPVLSCVISLVLMMVGFMAFKHLTTRYFPNYQSPRIEVNTSYPGASAQLVETDVTSILENAISGVPGIDTIESQSTQGNSQIELHLTATADKQDISNQVRDKITKAAANELPSSVDTPVVRTGRNDSELMDITFSDSDATPLQVQDLLNRSLVNALSNIDGVANIDTFGADDYAMHVTVNPLKLKAYDLSISDISQAIQKNNLSLPAGQISSKQVVIPIYTKTGLTSAKQFDQIPIKSVNGTTIRINDIGHSHLGYRHMNPTIAKVNGKKVVVLQIDYSPDSNPILTAKQVLHKLNELKPELPKSMKSLVFYNQATFMQKSVSEVYQNIIIAMLCVVLVIFGFLGNWRAAIIPIVTIPICLLSSFAIINLLGFSINVISLLALVVSIGLVVDDAIVVVENSHRHIESGLSPKQAAKKGSHQLLFALIAMTLTLTAVYIPIGFQHGHSAVILRQFAFTLAGSVIISGFIAITLSPMMCAHLLRSHGSTGSRPTASSRFTTLQNSYETILKRCIQGRWIIVSAAVVLAGMCAYIYQHLESDFVPNEDQGMVMTLINPPTWASNSYTSQAIAKAQKILSANPNIHRTLSISDNHGDRFNALISACNTHLSSSSISNQLNALWLHYPNLQAHSFAMSNNSGHKSPVSFVITGTSNYNSLYQAANRIQQQLTHYTGLAHLQSSISDSSQQYTIHINHSMASKLGVNTQDIDQTIAALYGGSKVSTFSHDGKTYDVLIQANEHTLNSIRHFGDINISSLNGSSVPLSTLISIKRDTIQPDLYHYGRNRAISFNADLAPGHNIGQIVHQLPTLVEHNLSSDQHLVFTGKAQKALESKHNNNLTFILALLFIYLVLSAQFESFLDPIIILSVVPLCLFSALLALHAVDGSRNIYTDIGFVTLIGLIAKHGILITQFANTLREHGEDLQSAIINAAKQRLRPILMTTAAMVFGALPLVIFGHSIARHELGTVLISGLLGGTFFSLILIPVVYYLLAHRKELRSNTAAY